MKDLRKQYEEETGKGWDDMEEVGNPEYVIWLESTIETIYKELKEIQLML